METNERITQAWAAAQSQLPEDWLLDGLRCASTSLREEDRSDDWVARAVGPHGKEHEFRARDPAAALLGLAEVVARRHGKAGG